MEKLKVYKDKKVLITGESGFKGTYLSLWLKKLGAKVYGFSTGPPTQPNIYDELQLKHRITSFQGDITDRVRLEAIIEACEPEFIFHLAAQPIVKKSIEEPNLTFQVNTVGTLNLLDIARRYPSVKSIVVVTTDKVYENCFPFTYKEGDKLGGNEPYSASKACSELVVNSFREEFEEKGIALATVRAGNVIGGGDWGENRLIPDCVRAVMTNKGLEIRNPTFTRPWQFVLDCLYGYLLVGANFKSGAWNFGPKDKNCIQVEKFVNKFYQKWGKGSYKITGRTFRESECLNLDSSKAKKELGWEACYNIDKIIEQTVDWYKTYYYEPDYLYELTLKQIEEYENQKL